MEKKKNLRRILLAVLTALLTLTLGLAVVQVFPANAAEEGVLEGNTAEYTFENDVNNPWSYDRTANIWTRKGVDRSNQETGTLNLHVTKEGTIALEYFIDSSYDGGLEIKVSGSESKVLLSKTYEPTEVFKALDPIAVNIDDVVSISFQSTWASSAANYAQIKGLLRPTNKVTVTAEAGDNGQLSYEGQTQQLFEKQEVLFGNAFSVEAKPNEGYIFAYWADETGNVISYNAVLDITHTQDGSYKALFHQTGSVNVSMSQIDEQNTWKVEGDPNNGGYYYANMDVIKKGQTGTLTIEFDSEEGGYYTFDSKIAVNWTENLYVYLNGVEVFSDGSCNSTYTSVDQLPWEHQVLSLHGAGYRRLDFVYVDDGATASDKDGRFDIVYIRNVHTPATVEEANLISYEIKFNDEVGDVYAYESNDQPSIDEFKQKGTLLEPGTHQIAENCKIYFGIFPNTDYQSSIDPSQKTNSIFVNAYNKEGETSGRHGLGGLDYYIWAQFSEEGESTVGNLKSSHRYLEIDIREVAVAPQTVSVNYKVNDDVYDKEDIENGKTYTIPYGSTNQFTVAISDYPDVNEEFKITANGETVNTELVNGFFGFTLNNLVADTTVSIQIEYGDYYGSDPFLIYIVMDLQGNIQDNLKPLGNVQIENDSEKPWAFSSTYSDGEMIAYIAGYSGSGQGEGTSALKFTVTGGGSLAFDFYFTGYKNWQMAGYDYTKALGDPGVGTFNSGKTMAVAQGDAEAQILIPDVVSSLKETLGLGWFHANIPVNSTAVGSEVNDDTEVVIYVGYGDYWDSYENDVMAIRNIMYLQGESTVNFKVVDNEEADTTEYGTIDAKIAGAAVQTGHTAQMGDKLVLTAKPSDGNSFYLWRDSTTKEVLSYDPSITITVVGTVSVEAVMAPAGTYAARIGETFYTDLPAAFKAAKEGLDKTVIVADDITVEGEIAVEAGIKLVIPFNGDGDYYAEGNAKTATNRVSWGTSALEEKYLFRKVTFSGNVTVAGELYVGGVLHYPDQSAQAHTSGAYSELVVNGKVTVAAGGVLDVCGRVTGSGSITVQAEGKILQPFLILDFAGGTNTSGLYGLDQTPFNRYSVINVQCTEGLKIEYKGELWGHVSLYAIGGVNALDAPIISYSEGTEREPRGFITLTEGGSVTAIYHDDAERKIPDAQNNNNTVDIGYTELIFESSTPEGGALANSLTMTYSIVTISTANVVGFSVPYNYQITLKTGKYRLEGNFKLMPGSSLTVEEGATLTVASGQNLLIYDGLEQSKMSGKSYPSAAELKGAKYSTNANFTVNGTFVVEAGTSQYPSMLLGVIQTTNTNGSAKIEIGANVILSGKIVDGGLTGYDCNQTEYLSTARLYDKAHKALASIPVGEDGKTQEKLTFTSDYSGTETFSLPAVNLMWDNFNDYKSKTAETHAEHGTDGSHWVEGKTDSVEGLKGAWRIDHSAHTYDWTPTDADKNFGEANFKTMTHQCTAIGCTETDHRELLKNIEAFANETFKGTAFAAKDLFEKLYAGLGEVGASFDALELKEAKTYEVTVTLDESKAYFLSGNGVSETATFSFTVTPLDISALSEEDFQVEGLETFTYNGDKQTNDEFTVTWNGFSVGLSNREWTNNVNACEKGAEEGASVTVTASEGNFTGSLTFHFAIAKKQITVTVKPQTHGFDGTIPEPTAVRTTDWTVDSGAICYQGGKEDDLGITFTLENGAADVKEGGYPLVGHSTNPNYDITFTEAVLTITQKDIAGGTVSGIEDYTYNGKPQTPTVALSVVLTGEEGTSLVQDKDFEVEFGGDTTNVGTVTVTITGKGNYTGTIADKSYKIDKAKVTVTVNPQTYTYNRSVQSYNGAAEGAWKADGLQNGENKSILDVTLEGSATDAGTHAVTASYHEDGNYTVTFEGADAALVIEKAAISSVTVDGSYTYTGTKQTPKLTVQAGEGKLTLEADEYTVEYDDSALTDAKTYTVTVTTTHKNFQGTAETTFTVDRKSLEGATVAVGGAYTYNGKPQTVEEENITVKVEGVTGTVTFTVKADGYENNTVVSNMGATVTVVGNGNFEGEATGNFSIGKKKIAIQPNDVTATYGDEEKELTFKVLETNGGLEAGDKETELKVTLTRDQGKNVNSYVIRITSATAANYEIDYSATGTYKIEKKTVQVTILDQRWATYTGAEQSVRSDKQDWKLDDELAYGETADVLGITLTGAGKDVNADGYAIAGHTTATNYTVNFIETGKFYIGKATVTVKAENRETPEGEVQAALSFTVAGYFEDVEAFKATIAISVEGDVETSKAGEKLTIVVKFRDGTTEETYPNYTVNFENGTYTIMDAMFKGVTFTGDTVTYDGGAHTITVAGLDLADKHQGAEVEYTMNGEPFTAQTEAGEYTVTATVTLGQYKPLELTATLKIERREVKVTIAEKNSVYGSALADLTFTYTNGIEKDNEEIENAVHLTTTATPTSSVGGEYTITATFDPLKNYTFSVGNEGQRARYTLTPKPIDVTVKEQKWATYTGKAQNAHTTVEDWDVADGALVGQDSKTGLGVTLTGSGTDAGSHDITAAWNNQNYTVTFKGAAGLEAEDQTVKAAFVIAPKDLGGAVIAVSGEYTYNGSAQTPEGEEVTVTLADFGTLTLTKDYTFTAKDNVNASAKAVLTVEGTNNFCGTAETNFTIAPKDIAEAKIAVTEEYIVFKNKKWEPTFSAALAGFETFAKETDYTVSYGENLHAGKEAGSITLRGTGNFCGTATKTFEIEAAALATVTVGEGDFTYTGKGIAPELTVKSENGLTLGKGDYEVSYGEHGNVNAGLVPVTVTATNGDYTGTAETTFTIAPRDIGGATVKVTGNYIYNGSAQTPADSEVTVTLTGYTVTYTFTATNNIDATEEALVTVTGTENFCGTATANFKISPKELTVTLKEQRFPYCGSVPALDQTAYEITGGELCKRDGTEDALGVSITSPEAKKDVNNYALKAEASNENYAVTFVTAGASLVIERKAIEVEADAVTAVYGEAQKPLTYTAKGLVEGEKKEDVLDVKLSVETFRNVGEYAITGSGSALNYSFTVKGATYTVVARELTVTISPQRSVYDGKEPVIDGAAYEITSGEIVRWDGVEDDLHIVLTKETGVTAGGYAIKGAFENDNYNVTFIDGVYTVEKCELTVEIYDQGETYNYEHRYTFNATAWGISEGALAEGELRETLGIVLTREEGVNAGEYKITAVWDNENYAVSFTGQYVSEGDEWSGKAGVFTIEKQDVSETGNFSIGVGSGGTLVGNVLKNVRYVGDPLTVTGFVMVREGEDFVPLTANVSLETIEDVGEFEVTVSVQDENYCGEAVFTVIVTDAEGYTPHLKEVLARLEELAEGVGQSALTEENFAALKEMQKLLSELSEDERAVADVSEYEALVDAWNSAAHIEDTVQAAVMLADAPIASLMEAAAALTALAALAYLAFKGGIL